MFKGKSLITGGIGSLKSICYKSFKNYNIKRLVVFSRDELKQSEMSNSEPFKKYSNKLRFFLGDVRDSDRLRRALNNIDINTCSCIKTSASCRI